MAKKKLKLEKIASERLPRIISAPSPEDLRPSKAERNYYKRCYLMEKMARKYPGEIGEKPIMAGAY